MRRLQKFSSEVLDWAANQLSIEAGLPFAPLPNVGSAEERRMALKLLRRNREREAARKERQRTQGGGQ